MSGDSEHIELLRRGPRLWNAWRAENPSIIPNLIGVTLSIGDRQMGPINGGPINLAHARLRHAFLRFATLTGANLEGADLADTDLREARLEGANLVGADLSDAVLAGADLANADLTSANLCGADLSGVRNVTAAQLHAAEGDKTTVLSPDVERPLIWTVAQVDDRTPARARTAPHRATPVEEAMPAPTRARLAPRRGEPPAKAEPPETSRHTTWLVGGPRGVGRPRRDENSHSESDRG
jgi:Pentapeptide repeats (8 copies)